MHLCYTLAVWLRTIFNIRNVVPNLERSNMFTGYGTIHGKLSHDKKAQWEQHLPELLQAYNSTRYVMTSYSPHYLMFGRHPHLPVDYYFLTVSAFECSRHVPAYMIDVRRRFKEAYAEAHLQTNCEADKQKCYYD